MLQYATTTQSRGIGDSPSADDMARIIRFSDLGFFLQPLGGSDPEAAKLLLPVPKRPYYKLFVIPTPPQ